MRRGRCLDFLYLGNRLAQGSRFVPVLICRFHRERSPDADMPARLVIKVAGFVGFFTNLLGGHIRLFRALIAQWFQRLLPKSLR